MIKIKPEGGVITNDVKKILALGMIAHQEQEAQQETNQNAIALMAYAFLLNHPEENFT